MPHPQLHLIAASPNVDIKVNMGDGPATPTAGFAAFESVARVNRRAMTDFIGPQPFQQDVPVLLDGFRDNRTVERSVDALLSLGGDTIFKAYGPIFNSGSRFVFGAEPEFGEMVRAEDGTLIRCALILKLMGYVPADQAGRKRKPTGKVGKAIPLTYIVRQGDTLVKIAFHLYHDHTQARKIGQLNGITDVNRELKAGKVLNL